MGKKVQKKRENSSSGQKVTTKRVVNDKPVEIDLNTNLSSEEPVELLQSINENDKNSVKTEEENKTESINEVEETQNVHCSEETSEVSVEEKDDLNKKTEENLFTKKETVNQMTVSRAMLRILQRTGKI